MFLGALGSLVAAIGRAVGRRSLPRAGIVRIAGIDGEIEVLRDRWGIPHIYASSSHDLFFANGVVHAEDRLFQMEINRRAATGRLSEIFGALTYGVDRFIRHIGIHRVAREEIGLLDAESLSRLRAYVAGVNWVIESRPRPLEFLALRHRPDPWTEVDTLAWAKLMGWTLGTNWESELARVRLIEQVGPAAAADLEPIYPDWGWMSAGGDGKQHAVGSVNRSYDDLLAITGLSRIGGSNAWAVAARRSVSGGALLANDMHLAPSMPSPWYAIHLESHADCDEFRAAGASLPGVPGIIVGHNGSVAWGFTASLADVQDLYVQRPHPEDPRRFARGGGWEDARVVIEEIRVRGEPRWRREEVVLTSQGPIITPLIEGATVPLALQTSSLIPMATLSAGFRMLRARNVREFRESLRGWGMPSVGVVFADTAGSIGVQTTGAIPLRGRGDGSVPQPGWEADFAWKGMISFDELPGAVDPEEGFVATANNRPASLDYPYAIGTDWCDGYRIGRIVELLRERASHDLHSMRAIQLDVRSNAARDLLARSRRVLDGEEPLDPFERRVWRRMVAWSGDLDGASPEALVYQAYRVFLLRFLYGNMLGDLLDVYLGAAPHGGLHGTSFTWRLSSRLIRGMEDGDLPRRVGHRDLTWRDIVLICFGEAVSHLRVKHGDEIDTWSWGGERRLSFEHPVGRTKILRRLFSRGPVTVGGDVDTPNQVAGNSHSVGGPINWIPSFRFIVDLANLDRTMFMFTCGQSGQPASRHYDDLVAPWSRGDYLRLLWSRADVESHLARETRLIPSDEIWPPP